MAPATMDEIRTGNHNSGENNHAIDLVLQMHASLHKFDGKGIESMPVSEYWTENFQYYAPLELAPQEDY